MLKALSSIPVLPNKRKLVQYVRQWAITGALGMGRGRTAEREDCGEGGPQSGRATVREGCRQEGLHCPKKDGIMTSKKGTTTSQYLVKARGSPGHGDTDLSTWR